MLKRAVLYLFWVRVPLSDLLGLFVHSGVSGIFMRNDDEAKETMFIIVAEKSTSWHTGDEWVSGGVLVSDGQIWGSCSKRRHTS